LVIAGHGSALQIINGLRPNMPKFIPDFINRVIRRNVEPSYSFSNVIRICEDDRFEIVNGIDRLEV
jgi:hypothetical protein